MRCRATRRRRRPEQAAAEGVIVARAVRTLDVVVPAPTSSAWQLPPVALRREDQELETVWNGTMGRHGHSLTSSGLGSSLGEATGFALGRVE
jgi:hypothetical protein